MLIVVEIFLFEISLIFDLIIFYTRRVIAATGLHLPNAPTFPGSEHVIGYEDLSQHTSQFEGKSVLILGRG